MIWAFSMRGEDEGLTSRAGRMIQTAFWGIRGKYIRKKQRESCLNKRPKINGFLLCCDDIKEAWETSHFNKLTLELALFKLGRVNRILLSALSLTLPGLGKLYLNKNPIEQILPKASPEQRNWDHWWHSTTSSEAVMSLSSAVHRVMFINLRDIKSSQGWSGKTPQPATDMGWHSGKCFRCACTEVIAFFLLQLSPLCS